VTEIGDKAIVVPLLPIEVKPGPISIPEAEYPEAARKAHIEGLVVVEALVDLDGSVIDTRILKSSRNWSLDQAALSAASVAKFLPANSLDWPVLKWVTIPYRFVLTSGKRTDPASSVSLVTTERLAPPAEVTNYNDSVLRPVRGLHFVRLKPVAARAGAHGRLVPDSAAIRFNNEAMMAACTAYTYSRGGSLRRPASYYMQSDWYYLVIDSGTCRVFQRDHSHYPSSRAEVHDVDTLMVKPGSLDTNYVEMPGWTALPRYVPLKLEFAAGRMSRTIQAPMFGPEVQ
jgi:TonB family protein